MHFNLGYLIFRLAVFTSSACVTMVTQKLHAIPRKYKARENLIDFSVVQIQYFGKAFFLQKRFHFLKNRSFKYENFGLV